MKQIQHRAFAAVVFGAAAVFGLTPANQASADDALGRDALTALFANKSIVYPYKESDENAVVFMDRFGGTETYVPCEFSHGTWWVSDDARLCWQDSQENNMGDPAPNCFTPQVSGSDIKLTDATGALAVAGKLIEGSRIPTG